MARLAGRADGGKPGRASRRDPRDARSLQPALADRHRREPRRGAHGGRGHHARHARSAHGRRQRMGRRCSVPGAVAAPLGTPRRGVGCRASARRHGPLARAELGRHRRLVRGARASALSRLTTLDPGDGHGVARSRPRFVDLALGRAGQRTPPGHLPRRGARGRDPCRAARGSATARGRGTRRQPAVGCGRACACAVSMESADPAPRRGRLDPSRLGSFGRATRRAHALRGSRVLGKRALDHGHRGNPSRRGALRSLPADACGGTAALARLS